MLAETFKYLYLLFSEKEDVILDIDDFIFTTEAHLLPLTLSLGNYSWMTSAKINPDIDKRVKSSLTKAAKSSGAKTDLFGKLHAEDVCRNYHVTDSQGPGYPNKLRHKMKDFVLRSYPQVQARVQRLKAADFVAGNKEHLEILQNMGIHVVTIPDGRIQLLQTSSEALSEAHADAGLLFMQEMIELSKSQKENSLHVPVFVRLPADSSHDEIVYTAGPSQFGYDLRSNPPVRGTLAVARPLNACVRLENDEELKGKIAIIQRGDCTFVHKARKLQHAGAVGGIIIDQAQAPSGEQQGFFLMSGDGINDVTIPVVFLFWNPAQSLLEAFTRFPNVVAELTSKDGRCLT